MMYKNYKNLANLSIRDFNSTACRPKDSCSQICTPSCNSSQVCVFTNTDNCDTCPPTLCMDKQTHLSSLAATTENSNNDKKTALIAGLTTGLVVFALIAVTIAGFTFYRRRKLQKLLLQQQQSEAEENSYYSSSYHDSSNIPQTPTSSLPKTPEVAMFPPQTLMSETPYHHHLSHWNYPQAMQQVEEYIDYNHPQSPFIICAHSLQIPHLDDVSSTTTNDRTIRRSLNLGSCPPRPISPTTAAFIERSSSVKVTKYDHHKTHRSRSNIPTSIPDDDLDETVMMKRAVSVKKNNSTSSSITRVGSSVSATTMLQEIVCAKPTIARVNTISITREKSGSITRNTSIKRINEEKGPFHVSLQDTPCVTNDDTNEATTTATIDTGSIDFYLCPPPPTLVNNNGSQLSIQTTASSSSSQSTLGDGSITVFWESTAHQ